MQLSSMCFPSIQILRNKIPEIPEVAILHRHSSYCFISDFSTNQTPFLAAEEEQDLPYLYSVFSSRVECVVHSVPSPPRFQCGVAI